MRSNISCRLCACIWYYTAHLSNSQVDHAKRSPYCLFSTMSAIARSTSNFRSSPKASKNPPAKGRIVEQINHPARHLIQPTV